MKRSSLLVTVFIVFGALTLPYVLAALMSGRDYQFIGFLFNPVDGASYLAKMQQGWSGSWRFTLPYTPEAQEGAFIFLYYLLLGHLARWINLPLIWVFHLARLLGAGMLLAALFGFCRRVFRDQPEQIPIAYILCVVGSGMGWLVIFFGSLPSDFWVAEAYPFLSMLTNPHFPLGLALIVFVFNDFLEEEVPYRYPRLALAGLILSMISQFGLVLVLVVASARLAWIWIESRRLEWQPVISLGLFGGPFLFYQYYAILSDPILAGWNAQNQTPSPPAWDLLLSFSPALPLAVWGAIQLLRQKHDPARRLLISWQVVGALMLSVPFALQRRFILGYYIPTAFLAVYGMADIVGRWPAWRRLPALALGLALPTNLLLILIGLAGAANHSPELYLTRDEERSLTWIKAETEERSVVIASPEMGRFIPASTGRWVLYGHPFETLNATQMEAEVLAFYQEPLWGSALMTYLFERKIDFIYYGPREQALGSGQNLHLFPVVFESGPVTIYAVKQAP